MKLIIDIPEEEYKRSKLAYNYDSRRMDKYSRIIGKGTSLDDVKAEINKLHKVGNVNDARVYVPINDVFDVIDKRVKGENR